MQDALNDERVATLLREAEDASRLLERLGESGDDPGEVREALDGIWRDLGRQVHQVWRAALTAPTTDAAPAPAAAAPPIEVPRRGAPVRRAATPTSDDFLVQPGPEDLTEDPPSDMTDIPESTGYGEGEGSELERWYTDEMDVEPITNDSLFRPGELDGEHLPEENAGVIGTLVASNEPEPDPIPELGVEVGPEAPWLGELQELIAMLGPPLAAEADQAALAEETARVQWATTQMDASWADYPAPVRVALCGLLAARARMLQERLEIDVGPRLALDRLRKYTKAAGLTPVLGILPDRTAESGSWGEDAGRWWAVLTEALAE